MAHTTGGGVTAVFAGGITAVADVVSISGPNVAGVEVDDNILATTKYDEVLPGDTVKLGEITMVIATDVAQVAGWIAAVAIKATGLMKVGTLTITIGALIFVVTGFVREYNFNGSTENNTRLEGTLIFTPDGKSDPTFS